MSEYSINDYINYRMKRAKETLIEVETLINNEYWNTAINRLYYACFYAVNALLLKYNINASTHSGIRQKFGQHFVITGKISKDLGKHYSELFEKRQKGDYNDFYDFDKETVERLFKPSILLIKEIKNIIYE